MKELVDFYLTSFQSAQTTLSRCLVAVLRLGVSFDRSRSTLFSLLIGGAGSRDVNTGPAHSFFSCFRLLSVAASFAIDLFQLYSFSLSLI